MGREIYNFRVIKSMYSLWQWLVGYTAHYIHREPLNFVYYTTVHYRPAVRGFFGFLKVLVTYIYTRYTVLHSIYMYGSGY